MFNAKTDTKTIADLFFTQVREMSIRAAMPDATYSLSSQMPEEEISLA